MEIIKTDFFLLIFEIFLNGSLTWIMLVESVHKQNLSLALNQK